MIGYLEVSEGHKSMGRLLSLIMVIAGVLIAWGAFVVAAILAMTGRDYGAWVGVILGGLAESGGAGAMKVWQKRVEVKNGQ